MHTMQKNFNFLKKLKFYFYATVSYVTNTYIVTIRICNIFVKYSCKKR